MYKLTIKEQTMSVKFYGWIVLPLENINAEIEEAIKEKEHYLVGDYIVYRGQYVEWGGVILNGKEYDVNYEDICDIRYFTDRVNGIVVFQDNLYVSDNLLETVKELADKLLGSTLIHPMSQLTRDKREEHRKLVLKRKERLRRVLKDATRTEGKTIISVPSMFKYKAYERGRYNGIAKYIGFEYTESIPLKKGVTYSITVDDEYGTITATPLEELETVTG